jgi:hypothetical protein
LDFLGTHLYRRKTETHFSSGGLKFYSESIQLPGRVYGFRIELQLWCHAGWSDLSHFFAEVDRWIFAISWMMIHNAKPKKAIRRKPCSIVTNSALTLWTSASNCIRYGTIALLNSLWKLRQVVVKDFRNCDITSRFLTITSVVKHIFLCLKLILCQQTLPHELKLSTVTDLLKAFLGNGSVKTFQRVTMEDVSQWTNVPRQIQRANELAGKESRDLCFLCYPCGAYITNIYNLRRTRKILPGEVQQHIQKTDPSSRQRGRPTKSRP